MKIKLFLILVLAAFFISGCKEQTSGYDVVLAFRVAGLEAEDPREMTKASYLDTPYVCKGLHFLIPSLGAGKGGRIFICPNRSDRDLLATYYNEVGRQYPQYFSWVFVKGNILVQLNGELSEETAKKYEAAIP